MRYSRLIPRAAGARALLFSLVAIASLACGSAALASLSGGGPAPRPDDQGAAQTQSDFLRLVPVAANDVIYNAADQTLYASVPASAGASGNSIAPVNPLTGEVGAPVFVGSDPSKLALADDGRTLYAYLEGAYSVRRFDTQTRTAGQQFPLGIEMTYGLRTANDMAVAPGNPNVLAVVLQHPASLPPDDGVAIFENGQQRPAWYSDRLSFSSYVAFSASESKLYGGGDGNGLRTMTVNYRGIISVATATQGVGTRVKFDNGIVYGSAGRAINPATGALVGTFIGASSLAFVPDSKVGRAFYLSRDTTGVLTLRAYDINTFAQVGSTTLGGVSGDPTTLVRWGSNGLAFRTTSNQLYLLQTSLIPSPDPIPTPTATPAPTPAPTPFPATVRTFSIAANDIVVGAPGQTLYVSVPSMGTAFDNTVTAINPVTRSFGASVLVGNRPNRLAVSDDGQSLYVGLDGDGAVRRVDLSTQTAGRQFALGNSTVSGAPLVAQDIAVAPGQPSVVAVARRNTCCAPEHEGVAVFDDGVMRPQTTPGHTGANVIEFSSSPSTIYGYNNESGDMEFYRLAVGGSGVSIASTTAGLMSAYLTPSGYVSASAGDIRFAGGRVYATMGRVLDPEGLYAMGVFGAVGPVAVDLARNRAFVVSGGAGKPVTLWAFDINTFRPLGSAQLPDVTGTPGSLVRWGADGLAFNTQLPSKVYLVQSPLVSDGSPVAPTIQFSAVTYNAVEGPNAAATVTVTRTGSAAEAVTVNYATSDGTAAQGSDYAPVSGTLAFAPGETTKTFVVPLIDDSLYEDFDESVGLALSDPTGGAVLGAQQTATLYIKDNDLSPFVRSIANPSVPEGDDGTTGVNVTLTLASASARTITINYRTADGTAKAGLDYVAASGTLTFAPGETQKTIPLQIIGDTLEEGNETFSVQFPDATYVSAPGPVTVTILDDEKSIFQFASAVFTANEGDGRAQVTVTRFGGVRTTASVGYLTLDDIRAVRCDDNVTSRGAAFARCDYATVVGTLTFAPGETQKSFAVPLVDDGYHEPDESVQLVINQPVNGTLGAQTGALLTIVDNDATDQPNPINNTDFFVRMQYLDFLSREPEAGQPWSAVLNNCAADDPTCDRVQVSSAFFRSQEFQLKGLFVFRFYKAALNRIPHYTEIVADMAAVTGSTTAELVAKKAAYTAAFAQRPDFKGLYDLASNQTFVDTLMNRYSLQSVTTINPASPDDANAPRVTLTRSDLVGQLAAGTLTRAQVVRAMADSDEVGRAEFNPAFVAMQYFGYLRRDPETQGYNNWLRTINSNPDDFRSMVNGFVNSTEYRLRFGKP